MGCSDRWLACHRQADSDRVTWAEPLETANRAVQYLHEKTDADRLIAYKVDELQPYMKLFRRVRDKIRGDGVPATRGR